MNNLKTGSKKSSYSKDLYRVFCSVPASKIGGGKKKHYRIFFPSGLIFPQMLLLTSAHSQQPATIFSRAGTDGLLLHFQLTVRSKHLLM